MAHERTVTGGQNVKSDDRSSDLISDYKEPAPLPLKLYYREEMHERGFRPPLCTYTLKSRHMIRNSSPCGMSSSTLPHGQY